MPLTIALRRTAARRFVAFTGFFLATACLWAGCASRGNPVSLQESAPAAPRYVFLFIGDGMGPKQVELGDRALQAESGESLRMTRLPVHGWALTRSANREVTDSAAAGTALAAGIKTNNGVIGQAPDGQPVDSIADQFSAAGRKVGVLTSVQANHATPASFFAHADGRNQYSEIARQFDDSGVQLLVGRSINPGNEQETLVAEWKEAGIAFATNLEEAADAPADARLAVLDPLLARPEEQPDQLARYVAFAIDRLDNPAGFFLMVEGGAIDWAGHGNRGWENTRELIAFDRAIETAYRFYQQHPDETLIVITADHETGGLSIDDDRLDFAALRRVPAQRSKLDELLPKDGEAITAEVAQRALTEALGIESFTAEEQAAVDEAVAAEPQKRRVAVLEIAGNRIADARAGVVWSTRGHTKTNVPIFAVGVGAERFGGTIDNTQVPIRIRELCGLPPVTVDTAVAATEAATR